MYAELLELIKDKDYFVITTNVDHQFQIAGFDKTRLFYTQGDYGLFQCSLPCHGKTYDNKDAIVEMYCKQKNMKVPSELIPKCPICGRPMEMNLRADDRFAQDEGWYRQAYAFEKFIERIKDGNVVFLELGVGYNTPAIIRFPFERMTSLYDDARLIRINRDYATCGRAIEDKTVAFDEDIQDVLKSIREAQV